METTAQKIDLKSLDKSSWETFRFEEIASKISETVDPNSTTLETYVGLEHLNAEDIHIRRNGTPDDVSGGKLKCYPGDVIFGKRRAYQRKAAIVDFEGICSAHAFVFRANPEIIDPKLFPFFLHSDQFMHRMVDISVGGLSPTINWGDLKHQEFLLPPKDQQSQLAELLWAMDEVVEKNLVVLGKLTITKRNLRHQIFLGLDSNNLNKTNSLILNKSGWKLLKVGDACQVCNHLRKPISKEERNSIQGIYPYYGPTSIIDYISEFRIEGEYVLVGEDGDHFLKYQDWNMAQITSGQFNVNNHAHVLKPNDICLARWVYHSFSHRNILKYITKQGATRYKLNKASLLEIPILVPPLADQLELVKKLDSIDEVIEKIESQIASSRALQKSLINQIF